MSDPLLAYEYVDGALVHKRMAGRSMPVPPKWVRDAAGTPEMDRYACLSKEIADYYPEDVRNVLVSYVKEYPEVCYYGSTLVIAGNSVTVRRRQWAASAVMNEITMRFGQTMPVDTEWVNYQWLRTVAQADTKARAMARMFDIQNLIVLEPQMASLGSPEAYMIQDIFSYRWNKKKPTVVSITMPQTNAWEDMYESLGPLIPEMLRDTCHYITRY